MEDTKIKSRKNNILYIIVSFFIVFVISLLVLFFVENQIRESKFEEIKSNENRVVKFENEFLGREINTIIGDLHYLHYAYGDQLDKPETYNTIANNWLHLSSQRKIYDQIRFLDVEGNERIRVNLSDAGAYLVPESQLQNKKDRYYFFEALELGIGTAYLSPLDLNIEHGIIEEPIKPTIRFSMPIYNHQEDLIGVIVINYLAEKLLANFNEIGLNSEGDISLLNNDGYWLSARDKSLEWSFMYKGLEDNNFPNKYDKEWEAIIKGEKQFITEKGLFTIEKLNLENKIYNKDEYHPNEGVAIGAGEWYIVSSILRDEEHSSIFTDNKYKLFKDVLMKNTLYFLLMLGISSTVALLVYINRKTYLRIKYFSEFDTLTKVFNRRAGLEKLNKLLPSSDRRPFQISLCFVDIDGLKQVNDSLGHETGDTLIITVAEVIREVIREDDFVIRMGGDEFLLVLIGVDEEDAEKIWNRIIEVYESINSNDNRLYTISVSHGIVSYNNSGKDRVDDLIKAADEKMYEEKRAIKGKFTVIKE